MVQLNEREAEETTVRNAKYFCKHYTVLTESFFSHITLSDSIKNFIFDLILHYFESPVFPSIHDLELTEYKRVIDLEKLEMRYTYSDDISQHQGFNYFDFILGITIDQVFDERPPTGCYNCLNFLKTNSIERSVIVLKELAFFTPITIRDELFSLFINYLITYLQPQTQLSLEKNYLLIDDNGLNRVRLAPKHKSILIDIATKGKATEKDHGSISQSVLEIRRELKSHKHLETLLINIPKRQSQDGEGTVFKLNPKFKILVKN